MARLTQHGSGRRREGKVSWVALLLVLLLLGAGGAFNYRRNLEREIAEQGPRQFAGYSDQDLEALRQAYRQETEAYRKRWNARHAARSDARRQALMGEAVREFERVQRSSAGLRQMTAGVAEGEARIAGIEREQAYRSRLAGGLTLHLERLVTL